MVIKPWLWLVISGWMFKSAYDSLIQDVMGMEKYIAAVQEHWITAWVTAPLSIILIIVFVGIVKDERKKITEI